MTVVAVSAFWLAAGAEATPTARALCKPGAELAIINTKFTCISAGMKCKPSLQASVYGKLGFMCKTNKLVKKKTAVVPTHKITTAPLPSKTTTVPPPAPIPIGGSRTNPVPLGQPGDLGNGWTLTVTQAIPDATAVVLATNQFNDAPAPGDQFFMVAVSATYHGTASSHLDSDYALRAVGGLNVGYTAFGNSCGVLPPPNLSNDDPETFPGGTVSGNGACWEIKSSDTGSLIMYVKPFLSDTTVWFALR